VNEITTIGIFVNYQYECDIYYNFFKDIIEKIDGCVEKEMHSKDNIRIISKSYKIDMFIGVTMARGKKYDVLINNIIEKEYYYEQLVPTLIFSKFKRKDF
jgi:hypothetical protein